MNIFKKYKSKSIAVVLSLVIYGLMFLLLAVIPGFDSAMNLDDSKIEEEPIQFQMLEDIALRSMTETKADDKKTIGKAESTDKKAIESKITNEDVDKNIDKADSDDPTNVVLNQDSVMMEQLKKTLSVLKEVIPPDSLAKNPIEQQTTEKVRQALAERGQNTASDWEFIKSNYKTIQNIRRVYPYVLKAKEVIDNLNAKLATMNDAKEKKKLIKQTEKELFSQFEKDVRKMSYSQGKLLLKLLARETNESAYGLIKTYKGGIPATFWYGVGLLFHENLKTKYDSIGEDAALEKIVRKHRLGEF
ncbi:hypothetical protein Palpr_0432 [Paludibacter propionicigenes WB4]|uniref:DUF4294 domain-containing protein n=1 Tax=Paludibacter propionicigenes (strain DSM 17365 / JCM 13257 / WB4) TaxID=694427 RepID=E4T1J8_PALPW|nr:DUF4294 domain-containing protein [Paludibacter propionicigenes]ADQ78592.1 hypothetical protein Palpr_0432 [Paludibacter propionicigenes WB4]